MDKKQFEDLKQRFAERAEQMQEKNSETLYALRKEFLDRKDGLVSGLMKQMKSVPSEEKADFGKEVNALKDWVLEKLTALEKQAREAELNHRYETEKIDVTLPGTEIPRGNLHPDTLVRNQMIEAFAGMGFEIYEGAEIETDYYNFTALNTPQDHPARDMQDTFFIERSHSLDVTKNVLLRSHTSNDEAHYMSTHQPPIRVLCPGRVFRNEAISARAHCFFHQVEGLYVDKNVSFADLKQVLLTFAREMFGADTKIRLRPSYFPFTEPSAEMDISCNICGGEGCSFCKHTGWVEILGCGMVDPHDLEACGIDSNVYTGYAFGMGVERITNLKYRVSDLRLFSENDVRFLKEFESAL